MRTRRAGSSANRGTMSGKVFAAGFAAVCVLTVLSVLLISPGVQDRFLTQLDGLLDRSVLVTGTIEGEEWVVASELREDSTCLLVELDERPAGQICDGGSGEVLREVGVTPLRDDPRWFFTGISDPTLQVVRVDLSEGDPLILQVQRPRGYSSGFYVTVLEPGISVERVTAVARDDRDLGTLTCEPAVASIDGPGVDCQVTAGGRS